MADIDAAAARETAIAAATASRELLRSSPALDPRSAIGRDIKLEEDTGSEALITGVLRERSPYPIMSEEAGWIGARPGAGEPFWAVDPLDGSYNYFRGAPLCCTSVALCIDRRPILGAVFDFNRDELFFGGAGLGLSLNGEPLPPPTRATGVLATGFPVRGDFSAESLTKIALGFQRWTKIRMIGSAALSLAWVAAGRFDAYEEAGIGWFDVAAGLALVECAGGVFAVEGESLDQPLSVLAMGGEMARKR